MKVGKELDSCKLRLLIDTSVWLDVAKDYRQRPTLSALEELVKADVIHFIVPRQVIDEFARNKERIIKESGQSLASTFRRVKDALKQFGRDDGRDEILQQLSDVDHRIAILGEAVNDAIGRIEALFAGAEIIETDDTTMLAAAQRAVDKRAPFHKPKNSMGDAILIELYARALAEDESGGRDVFAFVTHNKHDFSAAIGDERRPHPDLADLFTGDRSIYSLNLNALLNEQAPEWLDELQAEFEYEEEPRRLSEIVEALDLLWRQIWYNRHCNLRIAIEDGRHKVVPGAEYSRAPYKAGENLDTVWEQALAAAQRTEKEVGLGKLGPWTDFEWGRLRIRLLGHVGLVRYLNGACPGALPGKIRLDTKTAPEADHRDPTSLARTPGRLIGATDAFRGSAFGGAAGCRRSAEVPRIWSRPRPSGPTRLGSARRAHSIVTSEPGSVPGRRSPMPLCPGTVQSSRRSH
ncbi:PIN domain-containing protein [Sphingobium sp. CECT 9361]|uniref:PIN domain-containing protein n=1 Tax=Sphingobium sp. CECT 9361 TaxID=2845384 RepID=UPI001E4593E4|nr:PIN domain-containing protein [Sphingobium sp. CECT 9361]